MISKLMRLICKSENEYMQKCKEYMNKNEIEVLKLLSNWKFQDYVITERDLELVSKNDFPMHPKVKETNKQKQLITFCREIGVNLECSRNGTVSFYESELYDKVIKNHLRFTGAQIVDGLSRNCTFSNGRVTYEALAGILGKHYPRAPYLHMDDERWYMIFFFKHVDMLYNFDETGIYFP